MKEKLSKNSKLKKEEIMWVEPKLQNWDTSDPFIHRSLQLDLIIDLLDCINKNLINLGKMLQKKGGKIG
jgi:hypothetical protein